MLSNLVSFQAWLDDLYKREKWNEYSTFTDSNFLLEEQGEIAELFLELSINPNLILDNNFENKLIEEIGDMISATIAICNRFNINIHDLTYKYCESKTYNDKTIFLRTKDTNNLHKEFTKLSIETGKLARNIRRYEIGRHAHNENLSSEDVKESIAYSLSNVLNKLYDFTDIFYWHLKNVLHDHQNKMNVKYPNIE